MYRVSNMFLKKGGDKKTYPEKPKFNPDDGISLGECKIFFCDNTSLAQCVLIVQI